MAIRIFKGKTYLFTYRNSIGAEEQVVGTVLSSGPEIYLVYCIDCVIGLRKKDIIKAEKYP